MKEADRPRSADRKWAVMGLLALLASEAALLMAATRSSDFAVSGSAARFVAWLLSAGVVFLVAIFWFERMPQRWRPAFFWLGAIGLRLSTLGFAPGDDFWRYLWEGRIQVAGWNPYEHAVNAAALEHLRDPIWEMVRLPRWAAIYPPGAEMLFAALARLGESRWLFRGVFFVGEMLTLFLLIRINTGSGRYRASAWYAWNPAVAAMLIGSAHFDSVMILAMTAAMWALHRADPLRRGTYAWSWVVLAAALLGMAISLKLVPLVLLPVWAIALRRKAWVLGTSIAIPLLLSMLYGGPQVALKPLARFARDTQFNGLFWWVPELFLPKQFHNQLYLVILGLTICVIAWIFREDWRRGSLWALGAALILSPVLHPWYVIWILPLAAWRKVHGWTILSLTVLAALLVWDASPWWPEWQVTAPLRTLMIAPVLLWMAVEYWQKRRTHEPSAV